MRTVIVRRLVRTAVTVVSAAAVIVVGTSCGSAGGRLQDHYCALMPDSIGLYVGNPVTQMGYRIGEITAITASPTDVRVDFSMTEDRVFPSDVRAVTRSPSLLADRALELVGNYEAGPRLAIGDCVPLIRSATPKSLSQVIGSMTTFVNSINDQGSTNIGGAVSGLDKLVRGSGAGVHQLLTLSSDLLDSPDQSISNIGSILTNLAELTTVLTDLRDPMKEILLDARTTTSQVVTALHGGARLAGGLPNPITLISDLERNLADETQLTLDTVGIAMRKMSPHANAVANLLNPVPWWIDTLANHVNNHQFSINYRPPMYRIQSPDGLLLCGVMNTSMPGSCADVAGQPYAVDVALLQYVLTEANR